MKRIIVVFVFVLFLASCKAEDEPTLFYNEADFVFEINQEDLDLRDYFQSENRILINDYDVQYDTLGEYVLLVTDTETQVVYEITVFIVDTIAPEIDVPDTFKQHYDVDAELDLSSIVVTDNSLEEITYTTNVATIDMSTIGEYTLVITAQDSTGNLKVKSIDIFVRFVNYPSIEIQTSNVSNTSFSVQFIEQDIDGYKVESSYRIHYDGRVIAQGELTNTYTFNLSDLIQDTVYTIDMEFVYQIPGEEQRIITNRVIVTTLSLFEPLVDVQDVVATQDSLSFNINVVDPDDLLETVEVEVLNQDNTVILFRTIDSNPLIELIDLNFGQEYRIYVTYEYDFKDGDGIQSFTEIWTYSTLEKATPSMVVLPPVVEQNEISITTTPSDPDGTLVDAVMTVYLDQEVVHQIHLGLDSVTSYVFENLHYGAQYQIVVELQYEVVMDLVETEEVYNQLIDIEPMEITNFFVNIGDTEIGEDVSIGIELDNPNDVHIGGFQINGEYYGDDRFTIIGDVINFDVTGGTEVGPFEIHLETIYYPNYTVEYVDQMVTTDVKGPLPVSSISVIEDNVMVGQNTQINIVVDNPNQYAIESIVIDGTTYDVGSLTVSPSQLLIEVDIPGCADVCNMDFNLTEITYLYDGVESVNGLYDVVVWVHYSNSAAVAVTTAQELMDINNNVYGNYYLANNIDLAGSNWIALNDFYGYLDGNGYEITGLSITSSTVSLGLFQSIGTSGFVENIRLIDSYIDVNTINEQYIGLLAGRIHGGYIKNIYVEGQIDADNLNNTLFDHSIGGAVGLLFQGRAEHVETNVEINVNGSITDVHIGGVFGYTTDSTIIQAYSHGAMSIDAVPFGRIGGITGYSVGSDYYGVWSESDLFEKGSNVYVWLGGLFGQSHSNTVNQFEYVGTIDLDSDVTSSYSGGIVGSDMGSSFTSGQAAGVIHVLFYDNQELFIGGICGSCNGSSLNKIIVLMSIEATDFLSGASNDVQVSWSLFYGESNSCVYQNVFYTEDASMLLVGQSDAIFYLNSGVEISSSTITLDTYIDTLMFDPSLWDLVLTEGEYIVHFQ